MIYDFFAYRDFAGDESTYAPIALIHHTGEVDEDRNTTRGHFMADIKNNDDEWFRTSDNLPPVKIRTSDLSENAYMVLYKQL